MNLYGVLRIHSPEECSVQRTFSEESVAGKPQKGNAKWLPNKARTNAGLTWWLWVGEGWRAVPAVLILPPIFCVAEVPIALPQGWAVKKTVTRKLWTEILTGRRAMPLPNATGKLIFSMRLSLHCLNIRSEPQDFLLNCGKGCLTEEFFLQPVFFTGFSRDVKGCKSIRQLISRAGESLFSAWQTPRKETAGTRVGSGRVLLEKLRACLTAPAG